MSLFSGLLRRGGSEQRYLDGGIGRGASFIPAPGTEIAADYVGEYRAMSNLTVYSCVRLLADTIASLPWRVYRKNESGTPVELDPQPQLMRNPYPEFDLFQWKWMVVAALALRGNSYHLVTSRDNLGWPTAVLPLHPDMVHLERHADITRWMDPIYRVSGEVIPRQDIIHLRRFTMPGEPNGLSPIRQAALAIGMGLSAEEYGYRYFKDSANPSAVLETDEKLDDDAILRQQKAWIASHGGRRRPAVLSSGFKYKPIAISPDECLAAGTLVTMADGSRRAVEDITVDERVMAWDGSKLAAARVVAVGKPPVKPMVKITTARGRELVCTHDHPMLALAKLTYPHTEPGWIHAGDLRPGQHVQVALGHLPESHPDFSDAVSYFLGAMVADGNIRAASLRWYKSDPGVLDKMTATVEELGGRVAPDGPRNYGIRVGGKPGLGATSVIRGVINESGLLGTHSHTKFVPDMIMSGGPQAWREFLAGYCDGNGYITSLDAATPRVTFNSTSERLLNDVQHLLALLGVNSSVLHKPSAAGTRIMPDGTQRECREQWTLNISGIRQVQKFAELVQLSHTEKRRRLASYTASDDRTLRRSTTDHFDRVRSVERLGDGESIGITIEGLHTHVTNGLITHNSQFLETRRYQRSEIAMLFGIPPHMIGDTDKATSWGCLPGDSLVFTSTGPVPIEDVKVGEEVWSYDGAKMSLAKVTGWKSTGYQPLLTVRTRGRELRMTAGHHMFVRRYFGRADGRKRGECGWETVEVTAGELRLTDRLIVPHGMADGDLTVAPNGREVTVEAMELAGLYIGDGSIDKGRIEIAHEANPDHMAHYAESIRREFGVNPYTDGRRTRFSSPQAVEFMGCGFTGTALTKRVPGWVFRLRKDLQLAFLRGYLDSDGSVQRGAIVYSSANKLLLEDVRHLCILAGVPVGKVIVGRKAGPCTINGHTYAAQTKYQLSLTSLNHNGVIGSNSPRKASRLVSKPNERTLRYSLDWNGAGNGPLKASWDCPNAVLHKIVSIDRSDIAVPVYDIEVAGPANYVADGAVVGNTGIEQQSIGFVTYTLRPWLACIEQVFTDQLPRGQFIRFDTDALLRGDIKARYDAYKVALQSSWISPDEVRRKEELEPIPDGKGGTFLQPVNYAPLGFDPSEKETAPPQQPGGDQPADPDNQPADPDDKPHPRPGDEPQSSPNSSPRRTQLEEHRLYLRQLADEVNDNPPSHIRVVSERNGHAV